MPDQARHRMSGRENGYALLTVMVFALILMTAGVGFFAMSQSETRNALARQNSSEAFYLAEGALERARAVLLQDRSWRSGWNAPQPGGRGTYTLAVRDTVYGSFSNAVQIVGTGQVKGARRSVEVIADLPPTTFDLGIFVMGTGDFNGNVCLTGGTAHINGTVFKDKFTCGGTYTTGFTVTPPPVYTDPAHFPGATYYYVKGSKTSSPYESKIYDGAGVDITGVNKMTDVTSYSAASKTFTYNFNSSLKISQYFDETAGEFKKNPGDAYVVVNFGEAPVVNPPGTLGLSAVTIDGGGSTIVRSTVINTRFVGVTELDRLNTTYWRGALLAIKQNTFEPRGGIAFIAYDFQKQGGSNVILGTAAWPALVYVTRDVSALNSNFSMTGNITCLRNWSNTGGPNFAYNAAFIPNLPDYLESGWASGVSGTLKVIHWREMAAGN